MPSLMELLFGQGDRNKQVSTVGPEQQLLLQDLLSQLQGLSRQGGSYSGAQNYLSNILSNNPDAIAQFEAPYRQEFEQKTIPGLAERFAGLNSMGGGLSSSGFGQALGGAGAQLQAQLAGLRGQLQQGASGQALGQYNQLANMGLGARQFENQFRPGSGGLLGNALTGLAGGVGQGLGMAGGGGISNLLSILTNLLGRR